MPQRDRDPQPPADPDQVLAGIDLDALLDQAAVLTDDAVAQLGRAERPPPPPVDLEDPRKGTDLVEEQFDEINALVAQANTEAAAWATTGTSAANPAQRDSGPPSSPRAPPVQTAGIGKAPPVAAPITPSGRELPHPAVVADPPAEPRKPVPAVTAPAGAACAPRESPPTATGDALQPPPPPSGVAEAAEPAPPPTETRIAKPSVATRLVSAAVRSASLLLSALNAPFRHVGNEGRQLAGIVAVITLLSALVIWLLPLTRHR